MGKITLYMSTSSNAIPAWQDLVAEIDAFDGVSKDSGGNKGLPGAEIFAVEVAKVGLLAKLAEVLGGWLVKDRSRRLKIKLGEDEIELFDVTIDDQAKLMSWFQNQVEKHSSLKKK